MFFQRQLGSITSTFHLAMRRIHTYSCTPLVVSDSTSKTNRTVGAVAAFIDEPTSSEIKEESEREQSRGHWRKKERGETPYQKRSFSTFQKDVLSQFDPDKTSRILVLFCQPSCGKIKNDNTVAMFSPVHSYACVMLQKKGKNIWVVAEDFVVNQGVHPATYFRRKTQIGSRRVSTEGMTGEAVYLSRASTAFFNYEATGIKQRTSIPTLAVCLDIDFFHIDLKLIRERLQQMKHTKTDYHTDQFNCSHSLSLALTGTYTNEYYPPQVVIRAIMLQFIENLEKAGITPKEEIDTIKDQFYAGMSQTKINNDPIQNAKLAQSLYMTYEQIETQRPSGPRLGGK